MERAYPDRGNFYMMHAPMFNQGHTKLSLNYHIAKADFEAALNAARDVDDQHIMNRARDRIESLTKRST
jgi:hypothetical protein